MNLRAITNDLSGAMTMTNQFKETATANGCPYNLCDGSGWIERDGSAFRCKCEEDKIRTARMRVLIEQSGLRGSLLGKSFENYFPKTKKQGAALETVKTGGSLFIIGPWGCGKTHLLAASVNEAIKKGMGSALFSAPWLMKLIREDMLNSGENEVLEKCCEVEYLAVDDLGKEKPTETVQQVLFMIFDRREIEGLRTSVTSNYMPKTLASEKLDGAIIDRLVGMCRPVIIDGESYRRIGRQGKE